MMVYASPAGNDENEGTIMSPVATLERALDLSRQITGGEIILQAGSYLVKETIRISDNLSGSKQSPLIIKAESQGDVKITGGVEIASYRCNALPAGSCMKIPKSARNKILTLDLENLGITDCGVIGPRGFNRPYVPSPIEMFIDGTPLHLAQYPKSRDLGIKIEKIMDPGSVPRDGDQSNRGATFRFDNQKTKSWESKAEIWITGLFHYGYADDTINVEKVDYTRGEITTAGPHIYGFSAKHPWNRIYFLNAVEALTEPGEYVIDYHHRRLLFIPPIPLADRSQIQISQLESPLISLSNTKHITIENLIFENSRGIGINMVGGHHNLIKNCIFRNLGMVAVNMGLGIAPDLNNHHEFVGKPAEGIIGSLYAHMYLNTTFDRKAGHNNGLIDCQIYNTGAGGVILGGGNRITLEEGENFVDGCHIHHFNRWDRSYKTAVNIDGVGNIIRNCKIHDAPGTAILLHGNNHRIEFNEIYDTMLEGDDQGVFYYGRDPGEFGTKISYNYFHDNGISNKSHGTTVIYLDDGACGLEVYGNIFNRGGKSSTFLIGGGSYNHIHHNIIMHSKLAFHIDNRMRNWAKSNLAEGSIFHTRLDMVNFQSPPYSCHYPQLADYWDNHPATPENTITSNFFYRVKKTRNGKKSWGQFSNMKRLRKNPINCKGQDFIMVLPENTLSRHKIVQQMIDRFNSGHYRV